VKDDTMQRFEGDKDFPQPPVELWAKLTDARFLVTCIPDVESVQQTEPARAAFVVRPSFGFVRGTLEVVLQIADPIEPTSARVILQSKGIGSSSHVEAALALTPQGNGTRVHWIAEIKEVGGLLKMVPQGLMRGAAQKVLEDAWTAVATKLATPDGNRP
jgi:2-furoyl-CoA dehydrogenase large subunit